MINRLRLFISPGYNPFENIATEYELFSIVNYDEIILYIWRNDRTVVLGRNQNAWKECRVEELANDGGLLARRLSGGGAVYHDMGNLNYTFIMHNENSDVLFQTQTVINSLENLGIHTMADGRNDICTGDGRKISGNAYYNRAERYMHHGTVICDVDKNLMSRYLKTSDTKFQIRGIESVRSRVCSLKDLKSSVTVQEVSDSLIRSFEEMYSKKAGNNIQAERIFIEELDIEHLLEKRFFFGSVDWVYGKSPKFENSISFRGNDAEYLIGITCKNAIIKDVRVWTDSMDTGAAKNLEEKLLNISYGGSEMKDVLQKCGISREDYERFI